jgi:indole-3-glycerol phosphate synthase
VTTSNFLHEVMLHKQKEIADRKAIVPQRLLETTVETARESFADAMRGDEVKIVAEIKPASPSAGTLKESIDLPEIIKAYNRYASAISVLADEKYFKGSLQLIRQVAEATTLPVLCKDFIIDDYQVYEARSAGAKAVLLIVKMVGDNLLRKLYATIVALGMTPVVEVQNEDEVKRALELSPEVILINNRDLNSFAIDFETTKRLAPLIPAPVLAISASGIKERQDIDDLLPYASRFLIGSSLMQADNLVTKLRELVKP